MKQLRVLLLPALLLPLYSKAQTSFPSSTNSSMLMSAQEQNKETVRRIYEECLNQNKLDQLPALVSEDYQGPQGAKGPAGFALPVRPLLHAFPGIRWQIGELVAEGNKVAISWTWTGVQQAAFNQFEASGKTIRNDGMAVYELRGGKVIASRVYTDRLGFLQQMEALPADPTQLYSKAAKQQQLRFIDKFQVPAAAKDEFRQRMKRNRELIRTLPGFIEDAAYEQTDDQGNLVCITIASWANKAAIEQAKAKVQEAYREEGFDMPAMLQRLHITMERGLYQATAN